MTISYLIDRTRVPNATLKVLLRLAITLLRDIPEDPPPVVKAAADALLELITEIRKALVVRFRAINPQLLATEVDFDRAVDTNWVWLRKLLEGWRDAYGHPGLDALPEAIKAIIDLPKLRARAKLAAELHDRLFGAEGTNWVMSSWVEQGQTMATILDMIDDDGLADRLAEVVGSELPALLAALQPHYEDIVSDRMRRSQAPADNMNDLRAQLRWQIDHYRIAVETMRDRKQPDTFERVDTALRSLIELSKRYRRGASAAEIEELLDEEFEQVEFDDDLDDLGDLGEADAEDQGEPPLLAEG